MNLCNKNKVIKFICFVARTGSNMCLLRTKVEQTEGGGYLKGHRPLIAIFNKLNSSLSVFERISDLLWRLSERRM